MTSTIHIAAALIRRPDGRTLLVRKHGTEAFMQPGGKIDPGETPAQALTRELHEEIGLQVDEARLRPLGQFSAPAANEPGHAVHAHVFALDADGDLPAAAEIAETRWLSPDEACALPLAPLTRDHLLALLD